MSTLSYWGTRCANVWVLGCLWVCEVTGKPGVSRTSYGIECLRPVTGASIVFVCMCVGVCRSDYQKLEWVCGPPGLVHAGTSNLRDLGSRGGCWTDCLRPATGGIHMLCVQIHFPPIGFHFGHPERGTGWDYRCCLCLSAMFSVCVGSTSQLCVSAYMYFM